jgi:hypothetical protein
MSHRTKRVLSTFGLLAAIAVNVAAMAILLAWAVVVDHMIWRILLVVAACGAALAAASKAYAECEYTLARRLKSGR